MIFVNTIGHWNFTLKLNPPPLPLIARWAKNTFWVIESFGFFVTRNLVTFFKASPI